jgi:hypothetical protein
MQLKTEFLESCVAFSVLSVIAMVIVYCLI